MFLVTCHDPYPEENFTDDRELALVRVRWLDRFVGGKNWSQEISWNQTVGTWTHHYKLDCRPDIAALFKLTFA